MKQFAIKFSEPKTGPRGRFYFAHAEVPCMVDLSDCALHFYTNDDGTNVLLIRHFEEGKPREQE